MMNKDTELEHLHFLMLGFVQIFWEDQELIQEMEKT